MTFQKTLAFLAVGALSACGGGGGGGFGANSDELFNSLMSLGTTAESWEITPDANVNGATETATYNGFVNVGSSTEEELVGYLGQLAVTVNFSGDTVSGSAGNFHEYNAMTVSPGSTNPLGPKVAGSLSMSGTLTGTNESAGIGDGIAGTFSGSVNGISESAGELSGMIMGTAREGVTIYMNGDNLLGVGVAAR